MVPSLVIAGIVLLALAVWLWPRWIARRRREHVLRQPFPGAWLDILKRNVPLYAFLSAERQERLQELVKGFVDEKRFEACGGLDDVSEEMRITIAGNACLLLLNGRKFHYDKLRTILVYPHAYEAGGSTLFPELEDPEGNIRAGESWNSGSVVLAWDHVISGAHDAGDGDNVVLHEFAHQLDQADGMGDGAPRLQTRSRYVTWARVLGSAYEKLVADTARGHRTVMDEYGATNPAEFFAVATETFFEKGRQLQGRHPQLYEELKRYYQLDPAAWHGGSGRSPRATSGESPS